jgi:hypothetical protein
MPIYIVGILFLYPPQPRMASCMVRTSWVGAPDVAGTVTIVCRGYIENGLPAMKAAIIVEITNAHIVFQTQHIGFVPLLRALKCRPLIG